MVGRVCFKTFLIAIFSGCIFPSGIALCEEFVGFSRGVIIEKVICKSNSKQSYALYLPSDYTCDKKWPILYCFDPGAHGSIPVELFKEAAEKYGYIVAGSNNSKNGPWEPILTAIKTMWEDTHTRFSIAGGRVYTAGLSGGARVACTVGYMYSGFVTGVIVCSGGFPREHKPSRDTPFVLFGTAGITDFNYRELKALDLALDTLDIPHRIEIFEGGHTWPPKVLCTEAIEWMEIQAMKAGKREKDKTLIEELFNKRLEKARAYEESKETYMAYSNYKALFDDFSGLRDVIGIKERVKSLKDSKEIKECLREEEKRDERELNYLKKYGETLEAASATSGNPDRRERLIEQLGIADLRREAGKKEKTDNGIVAQRLLNQFSLQSRKMGMIYLQNKNYVRAIVNLGIVAEVVPEDSIVLYNLACAYSLNGEKERAIETLQRAVERGFTDVDFIERDRDLEPIRREASYQKIIETLRREK